MEISWNFVSPKKWEPWQVVSDGKLHSHQRYHHLRHSYHRYLHLHHRDPTPSPHPAHGAPNSRWSHHRLPTLWVATPCYEQHLCYTFSVQFAHIFICMLIRPPTPAPTPEPVPTPKPGTPVPTPVPTPGPTLPRQTPYPVSTVYWEFPAAPTLSPFSSLRNTGVKDCLHVGAYFHWRRRIRTRIPTQIPVLCRIFPLVRIRTLIPCLKCNKIEMHICPWDEHLSPKWVQ